MPNYTSVAQQTTSNIHAFSGFIETHKGLSRFGRLKGSKNPIKLLYLILSEHLKDNSNELETTRVALSRWANVSSNALDEWLRKLVSFGLVGMRRLQHGIALSVLGKGKEFIGFLRDDEPLLITARKGSGKFSTVIQTVIQDSPTLYTDQINDKPNKFLLGKQDSVDNLNPVVETDLIERAVNKINDEKDSPAISRPNYLSFKMRLAREGTTVETFLFAWQAYLSFSKNIVVEKPTGFLVDQCLKDRDVQRRVNPMPVDEVASQVAADIIRATGVSDPTIEMFDVSFNTIRQALECNQYN